MHTTLAWTVEIGRETFGTAAVMLLLAVIIGWVTYMIIGLTCLSGVDSGSKLSGVAAVLLYPLTLAGAIAGAYLGYVLMS